MTAIVWDASGSKYLETGVDHGVLYKFDKTAGSYKDGVAWNGLTGVTESPSGADTTDLYADNIKYASLRAAETFGATIEAYTYPEEFAECDGSAQIAEGVMIGQQTRDTFGLFYRTKLTNDLNIDEYKYHLIYGATASPSEKAYATVNDSPDAITFSWEISTTPVNVTDHKPTAILTIDTEKANKDNLKKLEDILFGSEDTEPRLPLPDEVAKILTEGISG